MMRDGDKDGIWALVKNGMRCVIPTAMSGIFERSSYTKHCSYLRACALVVLVH